MRGAIVALALALAAGEVVAQPYVGSELGFTLAPAMRLVGTDNDWGTRCDLLINPDGVETGSECDTPPPPTEWANESGGTRGVATGIAAGYRFGRFRVEAEYRYRAAPYHDYAPTEIGDVVTAQKADQELERAIGGAGDVSVHGVFANLAVDLGAGGARLTPFLGVGAGVQRMAVDYLSLWKRNNDPARIATFEDPVLRAKLAGTTTLGSAVLHDTMFGAQALAGLDYRVADRFTVGTRIRYAKALGPFESDPREWDQLRSHDSTVGRGSRILYTVETRDTSAFTVTLSLRYDL